MMLLGAVVGCGVMEQTPSGQNWTLATASTGPSKTSVAELLQPIAGHTPGVAQPAAPEAMSKLSGTAYSLFMASA
jgi:hypothetical protein